MLNWKTRNKLGNASLKIYKKNKGKGEKELLSKMSKNKYENIFCRYQKFGYLRFSEKSNEQRQRVV